jgi:maleamate amidohydrolase
MKERIWDKYITEQDRKVYEVVGFGKSVGFGSRPAILIIDVQYRTCGEKSEPILEAIKKTKTACGEWGWSAVKKIKKILDVARPKGVPIIYPTVERKDRFDTGRWKDKIPAIADKSSYIGDRGVEIIEEVAPQEGDIVVSKRYASAFFGTPLMTYLNDLDVDTLLVTGCTTSGCVRGTVIDGFSYGFKVTVVEDAVYDRGEVTHAINLFDMSSKYADVVPTEDIISYLEGLSPKR